MSFIDTLKYLTNNDVQEFSLKDKEFHGKVVDVYDGDTCKIIFYNNETNQFLKFCCRLNGIDTPELKPSKTKENREQEIILAKQCRNKLISLCCNNNPTVYDENYRQVLETNNHIVKIKCHDFDKYGRLLVDIFDIEQTEPYTSFNEILVKQGLAKEYHGGKKI